MQILFTLLLVIVTIIFIAGTYRAFRMSKKSVALIEKYAGDQKNPQLINEIFVTVNEDFFLHRILRKHNATTSDIADLHKKLLKWGDFRKYNRYIPITSFFTYRKDDEYFSFLIC